MRLLHETVTDGCGRTWHRVGMNGNFDYDRIKRRVPAHYRRWDDATKTWLVLPTALTRLGLWQ